MLLTYCLTRGYTLLVTDSQTKTYRAALQAARDAFDASSKRLAEITDEAAKLEDDIGRLRKTITALSALCSENPGLDNLGITSSVTKVMEEAETTMTTADVVQALENMGFDLASQKNVGASVHAILNRLFLMDKIKKLQDANKATTWRGPKYDPDADDIPF